MEELQARLDRVHVAQQEAEEEEEVFQQLKLACRLPEQQQLETTALHHLSGLPCHARTRESKEQEQETDKEW